MSSAELLQDDYLKQLETALEYAKQPGKNWPLPTIIVFKEKISKEVRAGLEYLVQVAGKQFVIESGSVDRMRLALLQCRWSTKGNECRTFIVRAAEGFDAPKFVQRVGPALQVLRTITPP